MQARSQLARVIVGVLLRDGEYTKRASVMLLFLVSTVASLRRKNCEKSSRRTLGAARRPLAAGHVECDIHIVARGM